MRKSVGYILAIMGAIIGAAGFGLFWWAHSTILQGNMMFGLNWENMHTNQSVTLMYQGGGIFFMVLGGLILAIGLLGIFRGQIDVNLPSEECQAKNSNALEIAKERYAKGEISKEEFETLKNTLS